MKRALAFPLVVPLGLLIAQCGFSDAPPSATLPPLEVHVACADRDPLRRPFFGDLHVHTTYSFDAHIFERLSQAYRRLDHHDVAQAWHLLEAMHVLGQTRLLPHARSHWAMLGLAWRTRDSAELSGQFLRLLLVSLGHLLGRLPLGNTGRANIGAFQPMAVLEG